MVKLKINSMGVKITISNKHGDTLSGEIKEDMKTINVNKPIVDACPVCDEELFYSPEITKRIAVVDKEETLQGWICPKCYSEFDMNDNLKTLFAKSSIQGSA